MGCVGETPQRQRPPRVQAREARAAIETAVRTTNGRVDALELQVFNRTVPNARHGGSALGRAERLANRLANRVAALERAAMTIPVGVTVNVINPGGPLHHDSETEE